MAVTTKLEVEYSQFKKGMAEAAASVKTLDAELKKNEADFKATGDAEKYLADKAALLTQKLQAQSTAAKQAEQMLLNMGKRGVSPTSVEYQRMATRMINAQAAMSSTQAELNNLNGKQLTAADSAGKLADNVEKIGKNVSLQTFSDGLHKLTDGMEKAYRTAVRFGRAIMRSAMDATGWADDIMTRAVQYGVDPETLQKMDQVAAYIDTDVDTIISAKDRLSRNRDKVSELLGISTDGKTVDDVFWEAGEAIMNLGDGFDRNDYAMQIFGRGWRELLPLITAGREQYEALMDSQDVLSTEQLENLSKADDEFQRIQQEVANLKREFWAEHSGTVIELLEWIVSNKDAVVAALTAIAGVFAALKTAETAANIMKIVNGLKGLTTDKAAETVATNAATNATNAATGGTETGKFGGNLLNGIGAMIVVNYDPAKSLEYKQEYGKLGWAKYIDEMNGTNIYEMTKEWMEQGQKGGGASRSFADEGIEVPIDLKPDTTAEDIAKEVGTVVVPATLDWRPSYMTGYAQQTPGWGGHANGLPFVPHDGYLAVLHRGERVMTATQNRSYTANSNLYVENMNMGGGMDAKALAEAMSAQNRRVSAGFGS